MRARHFALTAFVAVVTLLVPGPRTSDAAPPAVTLHIATQAPLGSPWMDALLDIKKEVEKETRGRVAMNFFDTGKQGDEKAVIERMQIGMLQGGLFTGIGLGEILPKVRILEIPFFYRNNEEIDAVKAGIEEEVRAGFDEKGMVFLGWSEVGWAYIFSKVEARTLAELRQRKIWLWQGDPLAERTFQVFGLAGTPLPLTDVLTSLETGMIDSVYNSPLGLIAMQWNRRLGYMSRMTVGHGSGALLLTKNEWQKIPPAVRDRIAQIARRRLDALNVEVARKNDEAIVELQKAEMKIIPIPEDELPQYIELAEQVAQEMVGRLYEKALLDRVKAILAERRAAAGGR